MKNIQILTVIVFTIAFGCNSTSQETNSNENLSIENPGEVNKGVIGEWECTLPGYESIISIYKQGDSMISEINFLKKSTSPKKEYIEVQGDKYLVINSTANEYYKINNAGDLELWDDVGKLTTANSTKSVKRTTNVFDPKTVIGENIFNVKAQFSKSSPQTLEGTNNDYWIVYYEDINFTFKVKKSTDMIQEVRKGKKPNL